MRAGFQIMLAKVIGCGRMAGERRRNHKRNPGMGMDEHRIVEPMRLERNDIFQLLQVSCVRPTR